MMTERTDRRILADVPTRRQVIVAGAATLAGLAVGSAGAQAQQSMKEEPSTGADKAKTSLHQEVELKASPHRIYEILLDSKQFSAFSGEPADISHDVGGGDRDAVLDGEEGGAHDNRPITTMHRQGHD